MNNGLCISAHCRIKDNSAALNGETVFTLEEASFTQFIKALYRDQKFEYSKFFKMDNLSKLGFAAAEILLSNADDKIMGAEVGVVLANANASLDTDVKHQESIADAKNYFPSPSVFVYTLPNIVIGEICIKHKFTGENACLISKSFDSDQLFEYTMNLFNNGKVSSCLIGWVDCYLGEYDAALFFITRNNDKKSNFESERLKSIYQNCS